MKITKYFLSFNLLLSAAFVSFAFWEKGLLGGMAITILWIILWGFSQLSARTILPSLFFIGFIGICLVGGFWGLQPFFLFLGVTAALNVWDSDRFCRRWKDAELIAAQKLERKHLFRILAVDGLAVILAVIGLSLKAQLNFGIMLLTGVLAILSLSWMIRLLRNPGPKP